jgi:hypothetical protein
MRLGFLLSVVLGFGFLADACIDGSYPRLDNRPLPGVFADKLIIGPQEGVDPDYPGGAPVLVHVSGRVTFDRWPVGPSGVDGPPVETPAAFVLVEAVSAEDYSVVIRTAETDAAGDFSMTFTCTMDYFVRARAQSGTGKNVDRVIHPRTKSQVVHAVTSQVQTRTAPTRVINLRAQWPWDHGGAFQILDTVRRLRASVAGVLPALGPLDVFWSHHNFYDGEFIDRGMVAGTFTDQVGPKGNPTIYLMGGRYQNAFYYQGSGTTYVDDHDEEDETVIAHEWASFLQLTRSRDNNFGGVHAGEELLPTASYSEGVVTAIGCALLDRRLYRDSAYDANYDPFPQAERTKDEVGRVLADELRRFLQSEKLREEFVKLMSGMALDVRAQIRLVPADEEPKAEREEGEPESKASAPTQPKVVISELNARRGGKRTKKE